jgi:signal peptidase I
MIPTLMQGDRIFVNRFIYRFKNLARGDVIVFRFPGPEKKDFIKRLIAFPGEKVEISEGKIKINGELVNEPRLLEHYYLNQGAFGQAGEGVIVPEGHFFVLGDNSLSSHDSRFWGYVPKKNLKGKAFCIFWPLDRIGGIR